MKNFPTLPALQSAKRRWRVINRSRKPGRRVTLAGDKLFDPASIARDPKVTPHIAVHGTVSKLGKALIARCP